MYMKRNMPDHCVYWTSITLFVTFSGEKSLYHLFIICFVGLYMVAVERQGQNRAKMMAEALAAGDSAEDV